MLRRLLVLGQLLLALFALPAAGPAPQAQFSSPDDAVAALVRAAQAHDSKALGNILGPGSEALVRSGDAVKDAESFDRFVEAYNQKHSFAAEGADRNILHVGDNDWALPIPLVRQNGKWHFDSHEGAQEIVNRRIGRNEIAAIRTCLAYYDAQQDYFDLFKQLTGTGVYAQRMVSTEGNYDGLYWPGGPGIVDSPLAGLVAKAQEEGYPGELVSGKQMPYEGYFYRILKAQGPNASGGARDYVVDGRMTGGFALVAWPAIYGASGIMTFLVNQDGVVFQKDLGADTAKRAAAITRFDPDLTWARVDITDH